MLNLGSTVVGSRPALIGPGSYRGRCDLGCGLGSDRHIGPCPAYPGLVYPVTYLGPFLVPYSCLDISPDLYLSPASHLYLYPSPSPDSGLGGGRGHPVQIAYLYRSRGRESNSGPYLYLCPCLGGHDHRVYALGRQISCPSTCHIAMQNQKGKDCDTEICGHGRASANEPFFGGVAYLVGVRCEG